MSDNPLISIKNLSVEFKTEAGVVRAVNDISFSVNKGITSSIVGESGSMGVGDVPDELIGRGSRDVEETDSQNGCDRVVDFAGERIARCAIEDNRFLASSHLNRIYYNPDETYLPPLTAIFTPLYVTPSFFFEFHFSSLLFQHTVSFFFFYPLHLNPVWICGLFSYCFFL